MWVSVETTPGTLVNRSPSTSATSSFWRTRTITIRSICPVTE